MTRGPLVTTLLVVAAVSILPTSYASAAPPVVPTSGSGTLGIRLVAPPGAPTTNPLAIPYIVERLAPGADLSRTVELFNNSGAFVDVSVYVGAASVVRDHFVYAAGTTPNDLSSWTSIANKAPRLAPHSTTLDTITTKVPGNASSGDRYAVIWAAVSASPPSGHGITLVSRVGVRMYLSIGPGGAPPSNFALGSLTTARSASGKSLIVDEIHNTGKSTLDLSGGLTLSKGPNGLHAGPFAAKLGALLTSGSSESMVVVLNSNFPRGPWRADLKVSSGALQRATSATITFPSLASTRKSVTSTRLLGPLLVIAALSLVSLVVALTVVRRRHRQTLGGTAPQ